MLRYSAIAVGLGLLVLAISAYGGLLLLRLHVGGRGVDARHQDQALPLRILVASLGTLMLLIGLLLSPWIGRSPEASEEEP